MPILLMPLFVSPSDVMTRMNLDPSLNGIHEVISSGIVGAQLHVQRVIDGKLQRKSHSCLYHLNADFFSGIQPGGMFRLEVPSGFIRTDTPIVLTASGDIPQGASPFDSFENIDSTVSTIERERGYILIDAGQNTNQYVRVQCDTGFEDGTTPFPITGLPAFDSNQSYGVGDRVVYNGEAYEVTVPTVAGPTDLPTGPKFKKLFVPMEQIPNDLYEAIMSMVPVIFDTNQPTNRNKEAVEQYKTATDHSSLLLQNYTRTKGFTFRPVWTA